MSILAILAGIATGIVLGVFGSGGSIITTPALLYLLKIEPKSAIAMGLGIVAITATIAAWRQWHAGNVDLKVASLFGLFGMAGTHAGARLGVILPVAIQLLIFAVVMYAAAWRMLHPVQPKHQSAGAAAVEHLPHATPLRMAAIGALAVAVGVLAGVVGVGGGFLIVPALVLLAMLPMKKAVGTSLAIVSANSFAGFAGYVGAVPIDYPVMGLFTAFSVAGSFAGMRLAGRVSGEATKKGFAVFLILVATYILAKSVI